MTWSRETWRSLPPLHMPQYPDPAQLEAEVSALKTYPPLVFAGEVRQLKERLALAAMGQSYVLQGGDCAETFADFTTLNIRDTFRVLLQMSLILTYVGEKPVVKIGRVAGQFSKPRSNPTETVNGTEILTYRGDMINSAEPTPQARTPDPERMTRAYFQSAATLNLLRAFAGGGYADLYQAGKWLLHFVGNSAVREKYEALAGSINKTVSVMHAYSRTDMPPQNQVDYYASHEALFLPYEEALTRNDSLTGDPVCTSGHLLWIGERTRDPSSPQVEFLRGIINPLGIKVGPKADPDDLRRLLSVLNPENEPGRITLIIRAGVQHAADTCVRIMRAMQRDNASVVWLTDPMHGNPTTDPSGIKTRLFSNILRETEIFIDTCRAEGVHPGGMHLEMTGKNVTECLGGSDTVSDLSCNYNTQCDPRLNASQSLELAFAFSERVLATEPPKMRQSGRMSARM